MLLQMTAIRTSNLPKNKCQTTVNIFYICWCRFLQMLVNMSFDLAVLILVLGLLQGYFSQSLQKALSPFISYMSF